MVAVEATVMGHRPRKELVAALEARHRLLADRSVVCANLPDIVRVGRNDGLAVAPDGGTRASLEPTAAPNAIVETASRA